jgi:hypothetical protein
LITELGGSRLSRTNAYVYENKLHNSLSIEPICVLLCEYGILLTGPDPDNEHCKATSQIRAKGLCAGTLTSKCPDGRAAIAIFRTQGVVSIMAINETKRAPLDWANVLTSEARLTDVVLTNDIAVRYKLPIGSVRKALRRLVERGLLSRVTDGVYANKLVRDLAATDFVKVLRPNSYVSLESALNHWGVSTQSPVALTCVTTGAPKEYRTSEFSITFRTISKQLYWGFVEKQTRYAKYPIAEPEKALLDWVYLSLKKGASPTFDEIDFKVLDKRKLVKYAVKYPGTVRNVLTHSLAFEHFAA